jgi:predicted Zn-ribbon and HTH transcriptional regulator
MSKVLNLYRGIMDDLLEEDVYEAVMRFMNNFQPHNREDIYQFELESLNLVAEIFDLVKDEIEYKDFEDNVMDTVCSKCGYWYGTYEYQDYSICPTCGHTDFYV